jgi:hypothetical protein
VARESADAKALRYIAEERVQVLSATEYGIRYQVRGSRAEPYLCAYGYDKRERPVSSCTCYDGTTVHPVHPRCSHVRIGRLLFRR